MADRTDTTMNHAFTQAGIDAESFKADQHEPEQHAASPTAIACDSLHLYGAAPAHDEFDSRDVWDPDDGLHAIATAFAALVGAAPDGTQLADERESLLWGFVNVLHAQTQRLDRRVDDLKPRLQELDRAQDGTEIKARELELETDRARNLGNRRDAFETMRDHAAEAYRAETGETWRPRHGSHTSRTGKMTSAAIDARDFIRARENARTQAHLPDGTLVAVAGGRETSDANAVRQALDRIKCRYPDMVLVHGGGLGAERIAAKWAERHNIHQIVCKPDWNAHGRAAPFRRNDELLNLLPKGLVAFPGSGITGNLVDKARKLGIPVHRVTA